MTTDRASGPLTGLSDPYLPDSGWKYTDVLLALVAGIAGASIVAALGLSVEGAAAFNITYAGQAGATMLLVAWLGTRRGTGVWTTDVGFRLRAAHWWGLFAGVGLQIVVALIVGPLVRLLAPEAPRQAIVDLAERSEGLGPRLVLAALIVVVAPLVEEVVFRGVLLSRLRRNFGPGISIVLSSAVFAGIHLTDPNALAAVPGLFLVGLALGWAALYTKDLSLALMLHAGVNLTGILVVFFGPQIVESIEGLLHFGS